VSSSTRSSRWQRRWPHIATSRAAKRSARVVLAILWATGRLHNRYDCHSEVSFTPIEGGEVRKHAGNVLTAFRRSSDGQWRIWRDANLLTPA